MANEPKTAEAPKKDQASEAELATKAELERIQGKIRERYQNLTQAFSNESNINNRYDLKIRMEEAIAIFELISSK